MAIFKNIEELDAKKFPITSRFLEAEGFVPGQISINSWREETGYLKTIIDGNKKIRFHFVRFIENEDSYVLYDPLFWYYSGYVKDFFENIDARVLNLGDYEHFMKRTLLKMRVYEQLRKRYKERLIRDAERQIGTLKETLDALELGFGDINHF